MSENYKIIKNDNGTVSCAYKFTEHSDDLKITYLPGKDHYMIEPSNLRGLLNKGFWMIPSDLLDALHNAGWNSK